MFCRNSSNHSVTHLKFYWNPWHFSLPSDGYFQQQQNYYGGYSRGGGRPYGNQGMFYNRGGGNSWRERGDNRGPPRGSSNGKNGQFVMLLALKLWFQFWKYFCAKYIMVLISRESICANAELPLWHVPAGKHGSWQYSTSPSLRHILMNWMIPCMYILFSFGHWF